MKKNNKGFFLAETIVMIALITTVMAFVYPNVSKLYENHKNKASYYDQTEDIFVLKAISNYLLEIGKINSLTDNGCKSDSDWKETNGMYEINNSNVKIGGLKNLYITGYMVKPSSDDYEFNKYLNRMKKTTYDTPSYRLIGKFEFIEKDKDENEITIYRYASIKVDNPNPNRSCNLGGV